MGDFKIPDKITSIADLTQHLNHKAEVLSRNAVSSMSSIEVGAKSIFTKKCDRGVLVFNWKYFWGCNLVWTT